MATIKLNVGNAWILQTVRYIENIEYIDIISYIVIARTIGLYTTVPKDK